MIPVNGGYEYSSPEPPIPVDSHYQSAQEKGYPAGGKDGTYYGPTQAQYPAPGYDNSAAEAQPVLGGNGVEPKKPSKKKWYIIGGVILLLVIVGAVVGGVVGSKSGKKDKSENADANIVSKDTGISTTTSTTSSTSTSEESKDVLPHVGILAAGQSGVAGGTGLWYSDDKQLIWQASFDGKNINKPSKIHWLAESISVSEEQKRSFPIPSSPLGFCSLQTGTFLLYVNMIGAIDAYWKGTNSTKSWASIPKTGNVNSLAAYNETQFTTFNHWMPDEKPATSHCVIVYQESASSALSLTFVSANVTDPNNPTMLIGEKKTIPLVKENDPEYTPLKGTSIMARPLWVAYNAAPDYNGAAAVYYQTKSGKIVGSVFDPNTTDSKPKLIRSEELGDALPKTPLTITTEATDTAASGYVREGNYTIYALSKPSTIKTWYRNNMSIRSRSTGDLVWQESGEVKSYKGGKVAAFAEDRSLATTFYVATEGLKTLTGIKQATAAGAVREWTGV